MLPPSDRRRLRDRVPHADRRRRRRSPWWPFTKNLSSRESIFFVTDSLSINPLEILLVVTTVSWLLQRLDDPLWQFRRGAPADAAARVHRLRGPRRSCAAWPPVATAASRCFEVRPLLYLALIYMLVTNLLTTRRQYVRLVVLAFVAVADPEHLLAVVLPRAPGGGAGRTSRACPSTRRPSTWTCCSSSCSALLMLQVLALAAVVDARAGHPDVWAYLLSQRRAAMIALFVGVRRADHRAVPPATAGVLVLHPDVRRPRPRLRRSRRGTPTGAARPAGAGRQDGALPRAARRRGPELGPLPPDRDLQHLVHDPRRTRCSGVGFGQKFLQPLAAARHQLLRVLGVHPAQLDAVDLDQDRASSASWRCCSCSPGRCSSAPGRRMLVRSCDHVAVVVAGLRATS